MPLGISEPESAGTPVRILRSLSLVLWHPLLAVAQATAPTAGGPPALGREPATIRAARLEGELRVDGRLDERGWSLAQPATGFTQVEPSQGSPGSERTEVRLLATDAALYVGARMFDREPGRIRARLARRDALVESDLFEIALDSYHDHRTAFVFAITPAGSIRDALVTSDGARDYSWDPVWEGVAIIDSLGWTAELRIPLSQLRFNAGAAGPWGIQLERVISRRQESAVFAFVPKTDQIGVNRYGHLEGLAQAAKARRMELLPYAAARAEYLDIQPGDPFRHRGDRFGSAGLDLKYGVSSAVTLSATVNPDFGQVEVDPAVVNLTAFETFFPDRRPFFVEGSDIFRFGDMRAENLADFPRVFHSRRIGRAPQRSLTGPGVRFARVPQETSITAAAKLSGRTSGGWSVGVLDALADEEQARFLDPAGRPAAVLVEPRTNYLLARVRRELQGGGTSLGVIATAVHRDLADTALRSMLSSSAYVGGLDLDHAMANRRWQVDASVLVSQLRGAPGAITAAQRASARYFQRPDARVVRLDSSRTALGGHGMQLGLSKLAALHWVGSLAYQEASPGFETNDLGFTTQVDFRSLDGSVTYKEDRPGRRLRRYSLTASGRWAWNFDGARIYAVAGLTGKVRLNNHWNLSLRVQHFPEYEDNFSSRGGPLLRIPAGPGLGAGFESDPRKDYLVGGNLNQSTFRGGYADRAITAFVELRPSAAVRIRMEPKLLLNRYTYQYVTTVPDALNRRTYGSRYVFADLRQTELSLVTRLEWTFTPKLSLQLFLQPLVSAGSYAEFKELRQPGSFDFAVYGKDQGTITRDAAAGDMVVDPDGGGPAAAFRFPDPTFNIRTFQGNAVLRWEYRRGSTLFLVWQQSRHGFEPEGRFDFGRDYAALFRAPAENVLLLKATYWIGR